MSQKKENSTTYWAGFSSAIILIWCGVTTIQKDEPYFYRGVGLIPPWFGWIDLFAGIWILFLSIRAVWRNRQNPQPESTKNDTLDEEAARAEAELDAMYLREHGEPPQKPKKDTNAS